MEKQIFITVRYGKIQTVHASADLEDSNLTIIDFDVDGMEDYKLTRVGNGNLANVYQEKILSIDDGDVEFFEDLNI